MCASEVGAVDLSGHGTVERGRLGPGHMLWVSPDDRRRAQPRGQAPAGGRRPLRRLGLGRPLAGCASGEPIEEPPEDLLVRQLAHGYTKEELAMVLKPMANDAYEPTFSMGDDSPLAPLAGRARPVAHYLRQRFAQVTNPPIDSLRERRVMSLRVLLGPRAPLLSERADASRLLEPRLVLRVAVDRARPVEPRDQPVHDRHPVGRRCPSTPAPGAPAGGGRRPGRPGRGAGRRRAPAS